ncbi:MULTISPECIES: type VII secretion protein EccCa [unclassified Mycobacterium]|uniref:type VII secretion protein EccCa n=1 Tax=unclassified Mycobacterium TaxID=2642494 RepID=UPI00080189A2|nr:MULTISPECIES: type VII secretion protein EccCa [unclassified Mycobacterium]OBH07475.1 type VII secretion protein EccC [Mycobacterium sp. E2699]OBI53156.1 type VII secretion protein EccC [Mycobacterium sp. E787]
MTQCFVPVGRRPAPAVATADIAVEAPPSPPPPRSPGWLPVAASIAGLGVMTAVFFSGSTAARNPIFLAFPAMTLASVAVAAGRGRRQGRGIDTDRVEYLGYLSRLRATVTEIATAQRLSLRWSHPDPDTLWTLIGGPRMWERRASDPDFCLARVGIGNLPLAARLVAPDPPARDASDPVTATALHRFLTANAVLADAPVTVALFGVATVTVDGDVASVRALLRAMICQLAVLHPPDRLLIAAAVGDPNRRHWDWLKWLPHNQHPTATDAVGSARMVYPSLPEARRALADAVPHAIVVVDLGERATSGAITGCTLLEAGCHRPGAPVTIRRDDEPQPLPCPDRMELVDALTCARRLAAYRAGAADGAWSDLAALGDLADFDPITLWHNRNHRERLRVPLGTALDGTPIELDIKEAADNGMGPHGLCVGATGSGKSELLRTIALGMVARNSPEELNLLLIDFKGGATFLDLARAPHVAAVVTNLADEAPLVTRMRDALGGEMDRRQRLLRAARCASVAAYDRARRAGGQLAALPTLLIIIDEFSEMLSQHPEFADMFVAIGRLGRSLGMHLLLASQRLDEGRLRGLEAHLAYRICLKTLTAGESRAVLGTLDAYQLPNAPGAGFLSTGSGESIRFQAAFVSGRLTATGPAHAPTPPARVFSSRAAGRVTRAVGTEGTRTVLECVLDRVAGHGPPAHQVWLPPLGAAPALDDLLRDRAPALDGLTVPIGVVDRPFEQCRAPLLAELSGAAGNVAFVGAPRSGKSTALCTLITALAATHGPGRAQFYCLDFGGGALGSVRTVPHVGAVAGRAEPELVRRVVAEIEAIVRYRQEHRNVVSGDGDRLSDVFLVVDGWAGLRREFEELEAPVSALAAQGLSFGVHVVLSASRWAEIRPSLRDQIGTRIELRLGDPADSEIDRKRAQQVPLDRPGRGLSREGLHMVLALPTDRFRTDGPAAPPIALLPRHVDHDVVVQRAGAEIGACVLLGLQERGLRPVSVDFGRHAHLLILGDTGCGKTATLRTLCHEIVRTKTVAEAQLLIVDFHRSLLGVVESEHLAGYAGSPAALGATVPDLLDSLRRRMPPSDASPAQLSAGSWWSGPDLYVLIDDHDLVATAAGNPLGAVVDYLPYAKDLGLHLVVARRGGAERALFEPLLTGLRDLGCMTLTMSGRPDESTPWGAGRPQRLPPGRGVLATRAGDDQLVQVAWVPPP